MSISTEQAEKMIDEKMAREAEKPAQPEANEQPSEQSTPEPKADEPKDEPKEVPQEELDRLAGLFNAKRLERVPEGYLSHTQLRFSNELARHKLLDILGDFSLVGYPIKGKVIAYKSGHSINSSVARELRTLAIRQFKRGLNITG